MALSGKDFEESNKKATSPLERRALLVESSPFSRRLNRRTYHLGSQVAAGSDSTDVTLPRPSSRASTSSGLSTYSSYQNFEPFENRQVRELIQRSGGCGMSPPRPKYRTAAEPNNHMVMAVGATDVTAHFVNRPSYSLREQRFLKHSNLYCEFLALSQGQGKSATSRRPSSSQNTTDTATNTSQLPSAVLDSTLDPPSTVVEDVGVSTSTTTNPTINLPKTHPFALRDTLRTPPLHTPSNTSGSLGKSLEVLHRSTGHHQEQERRLRVRLAKHRDELQSINHRSHPLQVYVHL